MPNNGHPVAGAIAGLLLGLFLAVDLLLVNAFRLDSPLVVLLPIAGLIVGLAAGLFAPLKMLRRGN